MKMIKFPNKSEQKKTLEAAWNKIADDIQKGYNLSSEQFDCMLDTAVFVCSEQSMDWDNSIKVLHATLTLVQIASKTGTGSPNGV